jgi:hypothetical protein
MGEPRWSQAGADISPDKQYRYTLWRRWADGPTALFVMLNPSMADASVDDPTIRRCIGFADREGAGALKVVNLYALRATRPGHLVEHHDPVGNENYATLRREIRGHALVIAAWGAHPLVETKAPWVSDIARRYDRELVCLGITKAGHPRHPLYVRSDQPLEPLAFGEEPNQ